MQASQKLVRVLILSINGILMPLQKNVKLLYGAVAMAIHKIVLIQKQSVYFTVLENHVNIIYFNLIALFGSNNYLKRHLPNDYTFYFIVAFLFC